VIVCERYDATRQTEWDECILQAKNGHFMFTRSYMEYHADRFEDFSCVFLDERGKMLGVLPANLCDGVLYTHQGLTFGGLVMARKLVATQVLEIFDTLIEFAKKHDISRIFYKRVPDIYADIPAQEDLYALFRYQACLVRRDLSSVVDLQEEYSYTKGRKWAVNKAKKAGIIVREVQDVASYWVLLNAVLERRHSVKAVHSLEEIQRLKSTFPDNIRVYGAYIPESTDLLAGTLLFVNKGVVHTQYLANSEMGREYCALDCIIDQLLKYYSKSKRYFSFGISTEEAGSVLNEGLLAQKEGFGARATVHDFYEILIK